MKSVKSLNRKPENKASRWTRSWLVLFLGACLFDAGCAVSLAPKFDQNIVDNLSVTSTEIFQLLAEVSAGTAKTDYDKRDAKYNHVIGKLEALALQINARPVPKNKIVSKIIGKANDRLKQRGVSTLISSGDTAPSATAIKNVLANIRKMKDTDKLQGVTAFEVQAFKGNIELFLDQALTYERFLNE
jgi:hypothetical protein